MYNPFCKKMFLSQLPDEDVTKYKYLFDISFVYEDKEKKDLYQFTRRNVRWLQSIIFDFDKFDNQDHDKCKAMLSKYLHWVGEDASDAMEALNSLDESGEEDLSKMSKYFSSFEEFRDRIESVYSHLDDKQHDLGIMDKCVAYLFWCRLSTDEIAMLKNGDVDTEHFKLHIKNKYHEERVVKFDPSLADIFEKAKKASCYMRTSRGGTEAICYLEMSDYFIRYSSIGRAVVQEADREKDSRVYTRKLLSRYALLSKELDQKGILKDLGRSVKHSDVVLSSRFCSMYELEQKLGRELNAKDVISLNEEFNKLSNKAEAGRILKKYIKWKRYYHK